MQMLQKRVRRMRNCKGYKWLEGKWITELEDTRINIQCKCKFVLHLHKAKL